jgi:hypothetical protein
MFIKTEVANPAGGTFVDMGTTQLLSVPYALFAKNVENNEDADADPTNELQAISISNDTIYLSNGGFVKLPVDLDISSANELQNLILTGDTLKISNGNKVVFPYDSSKWGTNGNKLYYNTGNVGIGTNNPSSQLEIKSSATGALFQVINANNDTVFAVYPDGVKVFVDSDSKGTVGGFAVSGRTPTKLGGKVEYFRVTPDSTRIYVNDSLTSKGSVGGFAVSGRTPTKGGTKDYFTVNKDSTRIYISDSISSKGKVGGFAVSGRTPTKLGDINDYFNISGNKKLESIESEARILWYPLKAAFLAGEVHIGSADSVGKNSTSLGYRTIAMGNYSQAMGYKAQSLGLNSTAIGNSAIANSNNSFAFGNYAQTQGLNSFAFGDSAISNGESSYALGSHAKALGKNSFAMGSFGIDEYGSLTGPTIASGDYSYAFGMGSQATGKLSLAFGATNIASDYYSIAIGLGNKSLDTNSIAIGKGATASARNAIAIGLANFATGGSSFALGNYTYASGIFSTAIGNATSASGLNATAMGFETAAIGDYSITIGRKLWAWGNHSIAIGSFNSAYGEGAFAMGSHALAIGDYSTTLGNYTKAKYNNSLVIGTYNDTSNYTGSKPIFIVGNGTADNARSNALTLLDNGCLGLGVLVPTNIIELSNNSSDAIGKGLATAWNTYSDSRIKKDQKPISYGLKELMLIQAMSYNHFSSNFNMGSLILSNESIKTIGFIAQDVYPIIPEAVNKPADETKELWTMNYEKLFPVVVKAIQEQQSEIELLKAENDLLKKQLNEINSFLENLKK